MPTYRKVSRLYQLEMRKGQMRNVFRMGSEGSKLEKQCNKRPVKHRNKPNYTYEYKLTGVQSNTTYNALMFIYKIGYRFLSH